MLGQAMEAHAFLGASVLAMRNVGTAVDGDDAGKSLETDELAGDVTAVGETGEESRESPSLGVDSSPFVDEDEKVFAEVDGCSFAGVED